MKKSLFLLILFSSLSIYAQVGIGTTTPDGSAVLDVQSQQAGFAMPRMTSADRSNISNPVAGLQVFDTDTHSIWFYTGQEWRDLTPIKAFGKVKKNGNAIKIVGATVQRTGTGFYTITFNQPMPNKKYIILLTVKDFNDNGNDDPGITYLHQTKDDFEVHIQDNDDGGGVGDDTNKQFMFMVLYQK